MGNNTNWKSLGELTDAGERHHDRNWYSVWKKEMKFCRQSVICTNQTQEQYLVCANHTRKSNSQKMWIQLRKQDCAVIGVVCLRKLVCNVSLFRKL